MVFAVTPACAGVKIFTFPKGAIDWARRRFEVFGARAVGTGADASN